ncbi:hypothetical protein PTQ49_27115 [Klebsiella pasteurii]|uniref:hypothetical protein n=1 Tax=Klebsiella pasteurii TaxID=2587529 RepID=UPI00287E6F47|nr:hypothetical protein [Klebsiella pasteurii]MDS7873852.1 hypothetical protein [Klebsiella pasteurii]
MTTITREQLIKKAQEQIAFCRDTKVTGEGRAHVDQCAALFEIALAAMDSEPNRNPVLAYADSYRDMEKQGVESVPIWSVITDLERNIAPLYRHAQQPVVPDELNTRTANDVMNEHLSWKDYGDSEVFCIAWNACRAAMLNGGKS